MPVPSERPQACAILAALLRGEGSLAGAFSPALKTPDMGKAALVQEYCYGVCRWYHRLQFYAQALLEKPLRKKDLDVYCLILLGLYQLFFMRTPAHAALNETVADTAELGKPWAKALVNAVLREAQRRQAELVAQAQRDYAVWYSHPDWLLARLKQDWPREYRAILEANNTRAPMTLRVNLRRITRAAYLALLREQGIDANPGALAPTALVLERPCEVLALPGFAEGLVSVQDEASQLAARLLPLAPGLRVLDACAAPGGKTCALLEAEPTLELLAADCAQRRLPRIHQNLERLGLQARVACLDLGDTQALAPAAFDRVLLDLPCSATGVIRRHPDIKVLRTPVEVEALVATQARLLRAAWPLLASGGYLLYCTCSVLEAENAAQVRSFLTATPSARAVPLDLPGARNSEPGYQLLPSPGQNDGFYYALLQKY